MWLLLFWVLFLLYSVFFKAYEGMLNFTSSFFSINWNDVFYLLFFWYEVSHRLICVCWRILASLGKILLGHHEWHFNVLVKLICQYFLENFYINVHHGYWLVISFILGGVYICLVLVSAQYWYFTISLKVFFFLFFVCLFVCNSVCRIVISAF